MSSSLLRGPCPLGVGVWKDGVILTGDGMFFHDMNKLWTMGQGPGVCNLVLILMSRHRESVQIIGKYSKKMTNDTKNVKLQDRWKFFVLVQFSAWASLENNVNKQTSIYPVNLIFLDVGQITYAVNALRVHSADIRPPAKACTAFECTGSFIS